jgi:hypothetical protein
MKYLNKINLWNISISLLILTGFSYALSDVYLLVEYYYNKFVSYK